MTKDTKSKPAAGAATPIVPNDPHSISFIKGLVARGEAARADAKRNLPSGATHEIVGEAENGLPIVVRGSALAAQCEVVMLKCYYRSLASPNWLFAFHDPGF